MNKMVYDLLLTIADDVFKTTDLHVNKEKQKEFANEIRDVADLLDGEE